MKGNVLWLPFYIATILWLTLLVPSSSQQSNISAYFNRFNISLDDYIFFAGALLWRWWLEKLLNPLWYEWKIKGILSLISYKPLYCIWFLYFICIYVALDFHSLGNSGSCFLSPDWCLRSYQKIQQCSAWSETVENWNCGSKLGYTCSCTIKLG